MRKSQYVDGIQIKFRSKDAIPEFLSSLAAGWNSATKRPTSKDVALHPTKARLWQFEGGLVICVCEDEGTKPIGVDVFDVNVTIPYIIVDGQKFPVGEGALAEEDKGDGRELLKAFVEQYWTGNPEPVKKAKSRQKAVSGNNRFPKKLIDLACTLDAFFAAGMSTESLLGKQIPDYEMSVWLRRIAGDTFKETQQFYGFLYEARQNSLLSPLNDMVFGDAVIELQSEKPAIYKFMAERGYLTVVEGVAA